MATTSAAPSLPATGRLEPEAAGARMSELFARHAATVLGLCRVLLRHREEAEDAVQQTFLSAYRSLLNGVEPRHPAAWLATIARNECRARIEARMREPLGDAEPEPLSTLPDPVTAAAARADLIELWRAIGELPRRQRRALLLREFSGLSYVELASALEISEPAVESLLFRARRELRLRLRPASRSVASLAPLSAIREVIARVVDGPPDPATSSVLAKIAAAPLLAKLAAGAAVIVVAGGAVEAVENGSLRGPAAARAQPEPVVTQAPNIGPQVQVHPSAAGATVVVAIARQPGTGTIRGNALGHVSNPAPVLTPPAPQPPPPEEPVAPPADDPTQSTTPAPGGPAAPPTDPAAPTSAEPPTSPGDQSTPVAGPEDQPSEATSSSEPESSSEEESASERESDSGDDGAGLTETDSTGSSADDGSGSSSSSGSSDGAGSGSGDERSASMSGADSSDNGSVDASPADGSDVGGD